MLFHIDPLRLWVHKVLPVVYDDSLSYYEVLAKVTKKLNEVIDLTEEQNQYIEEFSTNLTNAINNWEDGMEREWSSYKSGLNNEWANFQRNTQQYIENWKNMAESDIEDAIAAGINQFVSYFSDLTETAVDAAEEAMRAAETAAQDAVDAVMPTLESQFDERYAWKTAVGSPLVATTAAGMTDTTKVYVYAGSETGYVNGDWYYYDGTAWQDGGVYNSAAVVTDPTLSQSGVPADAKATGDEIADLKSAVTKKMELIDTPSSANRWDTASASVGYLHTNGTVYTGEGYDNYRYESLGTVSEGDVIKSWKYTNNTVGTQTMQMVVAYDASDNVMPSSGASNTASYTVPAGVAKVSVTYSSTQVSENVMTIINGDTPTEYIPYVEGDQYYIATEDFLPTITPKKTDFMFYSPNLFDESKALDGYFVNQTNGQLGESASHTVTDWIPIEGGSKYAFSMSLERELRYCWYDSSKTFISGTLTPSTLFELVVEAPVNAAYIRFSTSQIYSALVQFEKGETVTEYSRYGTCYLLPQYTPPSINSKLNLPSKIYATVGYELNIYFENLIENWTDFKWNVSCPKGMQLERGFRITPVSADVGTHTLMIIAETENQTISATASLIVSDQTAGSGVSKKIIVLGDSTTNSGTVIAKLNENFANDAMSIQTLGTRGTAPNNHEGRSGWTFNAYFNPPNAGDIALGVENPFYNPSTKTFDASYYFANSGISVPDWFFINLGINDTFSYTSDSALESAITTIKGLCDDMIASLKTAAPNMKIGLCLTIPPNHSQDAFGKAYGCGQTRDRYKRNNVLWVNDLIDTYDNRESENLYLIPIYTNLDTVWNMGMETQPVNARNTAATYESPIGNGGVHPVESGYWQIADVYTAFLKANA